MGIGSFAELVRVIASKKCSWLALLKFYTYESINNIASITNTIVTHF